MNSEGHEEDDDSHHSVNWFYGTSADNTQESRDYHTPIGSQGAFNVTERGQVVIAQPEVIQNNLYPITTTNKNKIIQYRLLITQMMNPTMTAPHPIAKEHPLLVITGPKYINNPIQAKRCAQWVSVLSGNREYLITEYVDPVLKQIYTQNIPISQKDLMISMRANLNQCNYDFHDTWDQKMKPSLMTYEIDNGIPICRALLCELCLYCPLVGELSDTITPQYMSDLYCLLIVESEMTESQLHRELVSGVSYPVGFHTEVADPDLLKFKIDSAIDAMMSSSNEHHFLTISKIGAVSIVGTIGNSDTFLILSLSNVSSINELNELIEKIVIKLKSKTLMPKIIIDIGKVSIDNYNQCYKLLEKILTNDEICIHLLGFMIDSGEDYYDDYLDLKEVTENCPGRNPQVTLEFNNLKTKMNNSNLLKKRDFNSLKYSDLLIHKLVELAKYRKGLIREFAMK